MNGVINICKQNDWTSNDVVVKLKGILKQRHIGHTGTLDPGAAGVLPICVGKATKLFDFLTGQHKTYIAEACFGAETDTQDAYGKIISIAKVDFTQAQLEDEISKFSGDIYQKPPMYSALKQNGKRLYELARAGEVIEIPNRNIFIQSIEPLAPLKNSRCMFKVVCGKGTYIRTICNDLGRNLGSAAYMSFLLRKSAAGLDIVNSYTLAEIEAMVKQGDYSFLIPTDSAIDYMPSVHFKEEAYKALTNGNPISADLAINDATNSNELVRIYCKDSFFGIGEKIENKYNIKCMLFDEV